MPKRMKICPSCNQLKHATEMTYRNDCDECKTKREKYHQDNEFKCSYCNKGFPKEKLKMQHEKENHTEERRKYRRESASYFITEQIISGHNKYGKNGIYKPYRSKWEYIFALYLAEKNIPIIYEQNAFPITDWNGDTIHYIPDFYIENTKTYIEIISNKNRRNYKKTSIFVKEYGKEYNLEIWDKETFKITGILNKYNHLLPNKENPNETH